MYPDLFNVPGTSCVLYSYGLAIMLAFCAGVWSAGRLAQKAGISKDLIIDLGIVAMVTGILGAKINYVLQYPQDFGGGSPLFELSDGGLSPLGAMAGGSLPYLAWFVRTRRQKSKMKPVTFAAIAAATVVLAVVGARVWHVVENRSLYPDHLWSAVTDKWRSGFVLYGGLIGGIFCSVLYVKWKKASVLKVGDAMAPGIALGIGIGRLGCFLQGCCFGGRCDLPWAMTFPPASAVYAHHRQFDGLSADAARSFAVHPTQLYEFLVGVGIFALLGFLHGRRRHNGEILMMLGIFYGTWRFIVESLRVDERPRWVWELTYSQWVSIVVIAVCGVGLALVKRGAAVEKSQIPDPKSQQTPNSQLPTDPNGR